jgi:2-oxo-4-hydroxy-4-carboxy-5-ureidoimidazoline decarboxylase
MPLHEFNAAPEPEAREAVTACADIPPWVDGVVGGRPYPTPDAALTHADALAQDWTDADVDRALAQHPRLGERHAGAGAEAAHSAAEQSGVSADQRLLAGNRAYEQRFDRVFLIRAAGRGTDEVLAALEQRLRNDDATERRVVAAELREIALLRLGQLVAA